MGHLELSKYTRDILESSSIKLPQNADKCFATTDGLVRVSQEGGQRNAIGYFGVSNEDLKVLQELGVSIVENFPS